LRQNFRKQIIAKAKAAGKLPAKKTRKFFEINILTPNP
jgi:hypothetical protein